MTPAFTPAAEDNFTELGQRLQAALRPRLTPKRDAKLDAKQR